MPERTIYKLSEVTASLESVIKKAYTNKYFWIKTEIVRLNHYTHSGHCYPDLVEKEKGKVVAEIRGNIWRKDFQRINHKFRSVLNEDLGDNMTVVVYASVSYHPVYGLALHIRDIDPEFTLGELARQKAETIHKLRSAGIYELNKSRKLPPVPKVIAIISVHTSKGFNDFMSVINSNEKAYMFHCMLFPAILQGNRAVSTIKNQLDNIRKHQKLFDAIAIIRGGGGDVGLSCYDSWELASAVAQFPIPVLTGIGHSTNETVCEMVSYESFITPTKIAEFLIRKYDSFDAFLSESALKAANISQRMLEQQDKELKDGARLFGAYSTGLLDKQKHLLLRMADELSSRSAAFVMQEHHKLSVAASRISARSAVVLDKAGSDLQFAEEKYNMLKPENILKRGFSISRVNGKVITDISVLNTGDTIETSLYNGKVDSRVEKINPSKQE